MLCLDYYEASKENPTLKGPGSLASLRVYQILVPTCASAALKALTTQPTKITSGEMSRTPCVLIRLKVDLAAQLSFGGSY